MFRFEFVVLRRFFEQTRLKKINALRQAVCWNKSLKGKATSTLLLLFLLQSLAYCADASKREDTVKFGLSLPMSASYGLYAMEVKDVVTAYVDQVNNRGGINGKKIEVLILDDGGNPNKAVANSKQFASDPRVLAAIAYMGAETAERSLDAVLTSTKMALVGAFSGRETLREPIAKQPKNRYLYNVRAGYDDETRAIVNQLSSIGMKRIAIYSTSGIGYKDMADYFEAVAKKSGFDQVMHISQPEGKQDLRSAVEKIKPLELHAVIVSAPFAEAESFVSEVRGQNLSFQIILTSEAASDMLAMELPDRYSRGVGAVQVMPYPLDARVSLVKEYHQLLNTIPQASKSYIGLEAFVVAKVALDAFRRMGPVVTRENYVKALDSTKLDLGGYLVEFTPGDHKGSRFVELTVIGARGHILR